MAIDVAVHGGDDERRHAYQQDCLTRLGAVADTGEDRCRRRACKSPLEVAGVRERQTGDLVRRLKGHGFSGAVCKQGLNQRARHRHFS